MYLPAVLPYEYLFTCLFLTILRFTDLECRKRALRFRKHRPLEKASEGLNVLQRINLLGVETELGCPQIPGHMLAHAFHACKLTEKVLLQPGVFHNSPEQF